ncbi:unnamed protein product, partial [marine sediment metagenome]
DFWEQADKTMVRALVEVVKERELFPNIENYGLEVRKEKNNIRAYIDFVNEPGQYFCELKLTGKPENYINSFLAWEQLEVYFYVCPDLLSAYMLPIRKPQLKWKESSSESNDSFYSRALKDIRKRTKHYFPEYNPDREGPKWGMKLWRSEFNLDDTRRKIEVIQKGIKLMLEAKFFPMKRFNCYSPSQCEMWLICSNRGKVNDDVYRKKSLNERR